MITSKQKENASKFSSLHKTNKLFVLPNAWDIGSAVIFEKAGFPAVATSSAGIAHSMGYSDGEQIDFEELLYLVERMAKRVSIPLSVDFERGFGESGDEVKEKARRLLYAGAIGFNIEDGLPDGMLSPVQLQVEKIEALCQLKKELDLDFVINARTCTYLLDVADEEGKLEIATERGNAFLSAGADCVFVPGAMEEDTMAALVSGIKGPLNILLTNKSADFRRLEEIGVRRLSIGSALSRWSYGKAIDLADNLMKWDTDEMRSNWFTLDKANNFFKI